jgi:deferrochelatase/peroxidase EfeB
MTHQALLNLESERIRAAATARNTVNVSPRGLLTARDNSGRLVAVQLTAESLAELKAKLELVQL